LKEGEDEWGHGVWRRRGLQFGRRKENSGRREKGASVTTGLARNRRGKPSVHPEKKWTGEKSQLAMLRGIKKTTTTKEGGGGGEGERQTSHLCSGKGGRKGTFARVMKPRKTSPKGGHQRGGNSPKNGEIVETQPEKRSQDQGEQPEPQKYLKERLALEGLLGEKSTQKTREKTIIKKDRQEGC